MLKCVCVLQETSLSSSDGVSRHPELRIVEFATPKARLFHTLKYGNRSVSSLFPVLGHDRMSASTQHNEAFSIQTPTALSDGLSMLSPQLHATAAYDSVDCDTSATESMNRLRETTLNSSLEDEACADQGSCFHKSSASWR